MYVLEVERKSNLSGRGYDYKESTDDVHTQGRESGRHVRSWSQVQKLDRDVQPGGGGEQYVRSWLWLQSKGRATYSLEMERDGDTSDRSCNY